MQAELNSLRPIDYDELLEAADLLEHFADYWQAAGDFDDPDEVRRQLVLKLVDRVFVFEGQLVSVVLHGGYAVVLSDNVKAPAEYASALHTFVSIDNFCCGDDGRPSRFSHLLLIPCVFPHYIDFSILSNRFIDSLLFNLAQSATISVRIVVIPSGTLPDAAA